MTAPRTAAVNETVSVSVISNFDIGPNDIKWRFTPNSITPSYSDDGLTATFTPVAAGSIGISVSVTGAGQTKTAQCSIEVVEPPVSPPPIEQILKIEMTPPATAAVGQPVSIVLGSNLLLDPQDIIWSFDPDTILPVYSADGMTATFTPASAGTVKVSVTVMAGAQQKTASCSFVVSPAGTANPPVAEEPLSVSLSGPASAFLGESVTFTAVITPAVPAENITWTIPQDVDEPTYSNGNTSVQFTAETTGSFTVGVSAMTAAGTQDSAEAVLTVSEPASGKLTVTISGPTTGTVGSPITLTAISNKPIDASQTEWNISPAVPFTTGPVPNTITFVPEKQTTYTVGVTVQTASGESAKYRPHNVHIPHASAAPTNTPTDSSIPSAPPQNPAPTIPVVSMPSAAPSVTQTTASPSPAMPTSSPGAAASPSPAMPTSSPGAAVSPSPSTPASSSGEPSSSSPSTLLSGVVLGEEGGVSELVPVKPIGMSVQVQGTGSNRVITGLNASGVGNVPNVASILEDFRPPQPGQQIQVVNQHGEQVDGSHHVGTGLVVRIVDENGVVVDKATIIVYGDVLGTGELSLTQLVRMAEAYTGTDPLEGPFLKAATFGRGGEVTLTDLCREAALVKAMQDQARTN